MFEYDGLSRTTSAQNLVAVNNRGELSAEYLNEIPAKDAIDARLRHNTEFNIESAARLMRRYMDDLCTARASNKISSSFKTLILGNADLSSMCCSMKSQDDCDDIVDGIGRRSAGLARAMAAMWNNEPGILGVNNIPQNSPNAWLHSTNAGDLSRYWGAK